VVSERTVMQVTSRNLISSPCRWYSSMASKEAARDNARSHP
jgi:hypothetical protein